MVGIDRLIKVLLLGYAKQSKLKLSHCHPTPHSYLLGDTFVIKKRYNNMLCNQFPIHSRSRSRSRTHSRTHPH